MAIIDPQKVLWKEDGKVVTVLLLTSGRFFQLNSVGSTIWKMLSEGRDREAIINGLVEVYSASRETLAIDMENFINSMISNGMLEP